MHTHTHAHRIQIDKLTDGAGLPTTGIQQPPTQAPTTGGADAQQGPGEQGIKHAAKEPAPGDVATNTEKKKKKKGKKKKKADSAGAPSNS